MNKETSFKIISLLGLAVAVGGLLFLVYRKTIVSTNIIGTSIQVAMFCLMIWARLTFGVRSFHAAANTTHGSLVTSGPYKFFRHPIYAAIIYFIWAGAASYPGIQVFSAAIIISLALIVRMLIEEKFLFIVYPEYKSYSEKTMRLIPFIF